MTMPLYAQVHLTLPAWVHDAVDATRAYTTDEEKVALAIDLSRRNVDAGSGGPLHDGVRSVGEVPGVEVAVRVDQREGHRHGLR